MDLSALKEAVIAGDVKGCNLLTEVAIQAGHSAQVILTEALVPAMQVVGEKFRCNEVYVPRSAGGRSGHEEVPGHAQAAPRGGQGQAGGCGGDRHGEGGTCMTSGRIWSA